LSGAPIITGLQNSNTIFGLERFPVDFKDANDWLRFTNKLFPPVLNKIILRALKNIK
jgi:hypothetical protein